MMPAARNDKLEVWRKNARSLSIPTKKRGFFYSRSFCQPLGELDFQPRGGRLSQLVNFNQTYPRPTTVARKNSGIVSGRDWCKDRRFLAREDRAPVLSIRARARGTVKKLAPAPVL